ncbi:chaplin [Streptomyces sp. NPDC051218]|uniref:chaplin n=1 Tax=Streptomyces sp. NPDC051218 TaxID=3365645 RepID=UPI00378919E2
MRIRTILATAALATATVVCGAGTATADDGPGADAIGAAFNSPGVVSGNPVQAAIDVPVNATGNTVTAIGALNPTFANDAEDGEDR